MLESQHQGNCRSSSCALTDASMQSEGKSNSLFYFQACPWVTGQGVTNSVVIREQTDNVKEVGCLSMRKAIGSGE